MSKAIPPTTRPGLDEEGGRYDHPAFGYIRVNRVQGGDPRLFMSNVRHQTKITLTIGKASMERRHYHDVHYAENEEITIEMSTVQFADLMAGFGTGSGVPCTLRRLRGPDGKGYSVPGIDMENTVNRYSKEVKNKFSMTGKDLSELADSVIKALDAAKVSKSKQREIVAPIEKLAREIGANMPFMADMFNEAVESIVQEAKAVVESYATEQGLTADAAHTLLGKSDDS